MKSIHLTKFELFSILAEAIIYQTSLLLRPLFLMKWYPLLITKL
jgi:hypothetical protein